MSRGIRIGITLVLGGLAYAQSKDITQSENWPCDTCHPTGAAEGGELAHDVSLRGHDRLGKGRAACLYCHSSDAHPEQLLALDARTVAIEKEVPATCERCHFERVAEWRARAHGKGQKCTNPYCHNPHAPAILQISLSPFGPGKVPLGILHERKPIQALPSLVGGPKRTGAPGATAVASIGVLLFLALSTLAVVSIRNGKGGPS
jgi:hypothetical protein